MQINESITKEEYRQIQTFYFYRKKHRGLLLALLVLLGVTIATVNIVSSHGVSFGALVFMFGPFIIIPITNWRIKQAVDGLYKQDIKDWTIEINSQFFIAKPNKMKQGMKIRSSEWYRAYELKSVIILYFSPYQFITICKKGLSAEELVKLKGIIYDVLGRKFKLKNAK